MPTPADFLQGATLLVAALGAAASVFVWFAPPPLKANLGGVTSGLILLYLNVLLFIAELKPEFYISKYLSFLLNPYGKAAYLVILGLLYGGRHGVSIACWVVYWVLAGVYALAGRMGSRIGFKALPDSPDADTASHQAN
jgi:hypothetical protein